MNKKTLAVGAVGAALLAGLGTARWVHSADHLDPIGIETSDPGADITDLYAWMNGDATKLNLILNVNHMAGPNAAFSEALVYAIHVTSQASYGAADKQETLIRCKFYSRNNIECWAGAEYVTGNISTGPLQSASQKMRVFAGRRNDPFFFELVGFQETVKKVVATVPTLTPDANGCYNVNATNAGTTALLVKQLQSSGPISSATDNSKPAMDTFAGSNVLSIAIELDKTLVTPKGPVLGVWASTHRAM